MKPILKFLIIITLVASAALTTYASYHSYKNYQKSGQTFSQFQEKIRTGEPGYRPYRQYDLETQVFAYRLTTNQSKKSRRLTIFASLSSAISVLALFLVWKRYPTCLNIALTVMLLLHLYSVFTIGGINDEEAVVIGGAPAVPLILALLYFRSPKKTGENPQGDTVPAHS